MEVHAIENEKKELSFYKNGCDLVIEIKEEEDRTVFAINEDGIAELLDFINRNRKLDIKPFKPCEEGLEYYNRFSTFEEAWNACDRGDWMLWIAVKLNVDDRTLTRAKALCANTVRHLMKDERSTAAVDAALMYADGKISGEELKWYARDAKDALQTAYWDDHCAAAKAAYWAASAACTAARAAESAYYDANEAAKVANRLQTANICRETLTEAVFEKVKQFNDN